MQNSDGSIKLHQGRITQAGHYLIDQIGNITPSASDGSVNAGIVVTQGNDAENGLGLLSSVARKGVQTCIYLFVFIASSTQRMEHLMFAILHACSTECIQCIPFKLCSISFMHCMNCL